MTAGGQRRANPPMGRLARFGLLTCLGITGYCVVALFSSHGDAHAFDVGAVLTGLGLAVVVGAIRWLAGINWGDLAAAAVLATLWDDLTRRR